MKRIYLDHGATTPLHRDVLPAMLPYYSEAFGNPSSIHSFGREARRALDESREKTAQALGAAPEEIIFTSGGTEANNLAIQGAAEALASRGRHLIASAVEHHAVLDTVNALGNKGYAVTVLPVDHYGMVDPDDLRKAIRDDTVLVTIMAANNEIGTLQPIAPLASICRERGVYFHTDAVQAIGNIPLNLRELPVDLLSLSAHKFYGPKGIGVLFVRRKTKISKLMHGGGQERKIRPGTENIPAIVGLAKAIEIATADVPAKSAALVKMRDYFLAGLTEKIEEVYLNGHPVQRLPGNVNVSVRFVEGESLLLDLDLKGISASSGSACTSGSLEASHVLLACGLEHQLAHGSLRFTLGHGNTLEELGYTLKTLQESVARLREMSFLYKNYRRELKSSCT
ncbi:MAG TPA: cysteine desulfurase NifS [Firmicutes bacterium]|nr:cysteine desulfurase NifS [Bacillota bacterium]